MEETRNRAAHRCLCPDCQRHPASPQAERHQAINALLAILDEKSRRLVAAFLARQQGRGGITQMAQITGLSRNTIRRGLQELVQPETPSSSIRRPGGGRKRAEKKCPQVLDALEDLLRDAVAGDPMTGLKWTHKSIRKLCAALRRRRLPCGHNLVARLLHAQKFSLRTNRKRLAGIHDPRRDRQFRYLARVRRWYLSRGLPVISVDTKKKEWVGNFKNPGRCWRRDSRAVLDHDFPSWALGQGIPYGIYDVGRNAGYVVIGTSHETAAFAGAAIRRWWLDVGRHHYAGQRRLLIQADGGGANGCRKWAWKVALQRLADEFGLIITVMHYPPGASKWNLIEHQMFSLISENWAGEPLASYEVMLKFIRRTRSATGFHGKARLDTAPYATGVKIPKKEKEAIRLRRRPVLPQWNYTIWPRKSKATN
jgi:DNA-binding phage protein